MQSLPDLRDEWVFRDGKVAAEGDSMSIDDLIVDLEQVADKEGGWTILYRHRKTGEFWELSCPKSEMHGGGPRRLRQLNIAGPNAWSQD
jgi:hypothetical protein